MTTSTTTRSIEIDATAAQVYAFVSDLERLMGSIPAIRHVVIAAVDTSEEGATTYAWTTTVGIGPLSRDVNGSTTREQCVPGHGVVYRHSMGLKTLETFTVGPATRGTRLSLTVSLTSPVPFLDRLAVLVASKGRGQADYADRVLAEIKQQLEEGHDARPSVPTANR